MTREEEQLHLNNMATEIDQVLSYASGMDYNQYMQADETREAIVRSLKSIGDAAEMLRSTDDWQDRYDNLDLHALARLKDAVYGNALEMDQHGVWDIIQQDLPNLKEGIYDAKEKIDKLEE